MSINSSLSATLMLGRNFKTSILFSSRLYLFIVYCFEYAESTMTLNAFFKANVECCFGSFTTKVKL